MKFERMRSQQGLCNEFQDLGTIIIKSMNKIEEERGRYFVKLLRLNAGLVVGSDGKTTLTITQTSEFKNIEVIQLEFVQ